MLLFISHAVQDGFKKADCSDALVFLLVTFVKMLKTGAVVPKIFPEIMLQTSPQC